MALSPVAAVQPGFHRHRRRRPTGRGVGVLADWADHLDVLARLAESHGHAFPLTYTVTTPTGGPIRDRGLGRAVWRRGTESGNEYTMSVNGPLVVVGALLFLGGVAVLWGKGQIVSQLDASDWGQRWNRSWVEARRRWQAQPTRLWFAPVLLGVALLATTLAFIPRIDGAAAGLGTLAGFLIGYGLVRKPNSGVARWAEAVATDAERRNTLMRRFGLAFGAILALTGIGVVLLGFTICRTTPC